jgi:hypothetical protein
VVDALFLSPSGWRIFDANRLGAEEGALPRPLCVTVLLGESYDDSTHEIAFFEVLPGAGGVSIVAGRAGLGDC